MRKVAQAVVPGAIEGFVDRALVAAFEVVDYEIEPRVQLVRSFVRRMRGDSIRYFDGATAVDDGASLTFARSKVKAPPRKGDWILERNLRDATIIQVSTVRHVDRRGLPFFSRRSYRVVCGYIGDAHRLRDRSYLKPHPRKNARVRSALSREVGLGMKRAVAHL